MRGFIDASALAGRGSNQIFAGSTRSLPALACLNQVGLSADAAHGSEFFAMYIYIYISSLSKSLRNSCWIMMLTRLPPCHHPHLQLALRESTLRSTPTDKDFSLLPTRRRCHQNQEQKQKVKPKKRRQPNRRPRQKQRLNPSPAHRYPKTSLPTALREESSCPSFLVAYEFPCSV